MNRKWRNLWLLAAAELLAMGLWFSASAVLPQLTAEWRLTPWQRSWLTMSVQLGFVAGALLSAVLNLPDQIPARLLFAGSAFAGTAANGAIALLTQAPQAVFALRFLTGMTLAGVYPPGMKLMATWCKKDRGLCIGLLVGTLTVGSATPHLFNAGKRSQRPLRRRALHPKSRRWGRTGRDGDDRRNDTDLVLHGDHL